MTLRLPWPLPALLAWAAAWILFMVLQPLVAPLWALLLPVLCGLIPLAAAALDRYDREQRFTVGYHVTARRRVA